MWPVRELAFAVPGDIATPTGGYAYDRRVMQELGALGWALRHVELPGDFPDPSSTSLARVGDLLSRIPSGMPIIIDGLAYGVLPEEVIAPVRGRVIALVHHPLGLETGLAPERAAMLVEMERAALARAAAVIVTSPATAGTLATLLGVPPAKITVALPGVEPAARAKGQGPGRAPRLLAVGSLVPRKGYDVLVAALEKIADVPWDCRIVGALDRSPETSEAIRQEIASAGLTGRVSLAGTMTDREVEAEYDAADLFVLASHYEGYGMVFAEAMSRGLPVVACAGGATAETVPADAGLLVPPGDASGLADALRRVLADRDERQKLADAAWNHAAGLPRWRDAAERISGVVEACP